MGILVLAVSGCGDGGNANPEVPDGSSPPAIVPAGCEPLYVYADGGAPLCTRGECVY